MTLIEREILISAFATAFRLARRSNLETSGVFIAMMEVVNALHQNDNNFNRIDFINAVRGGGEHDI